MQEERMRQVPSMIPSEDACPLATVQLGHKIGSRWSQRTTRGLDGKLHTEDTPAIVVATGRIIPGWGHSPLTHGPTLRTD